MTVAWIGLAYLIGAIPTSYLAARFGAGIDLREHGSRNLGATNLYRVLGGKYAYPVGVFDVLKGVVPVVVLSPLLPLGSWSPYVAGAAAIVGHVYPVYLRFRGGKGVATAAGVVIAVAPVPFLVSLGAWLTVLLAGRIMSLASMTAALVFPVAAAWFKPEDRPLLVASLVIAAFIVYTHRSNIGRLLAGTEPRLGKRAKEEAAG